MQLSDVEFNINKDLAWEISNATQGGNDEQFKYASFLSCNLHDQFSMYPFFYTYVNVYVSQIEGAGGLDKIG